MKDTLPTSKIVVVPGEPRPVYVQYTVVLRQVSLYKKARRVGDVVDIERIYLRMDVECVLYPALLHTVIGDGITGPVFLVSVDQTKEEVLETVNRFTARCREYGSVLPADACIALLKKFPRFAALLN